MSGHRSILFLLAGTLATFAVAAARPAAALPPVITPPGSGNGPVIVIDPPAPPGGGLDFTVASLTARGYVCRPYRTGHRCDATLPEPSSNTSTLSTYLCDANSNCGTRANKPHPAKVPASRFGLWSIAFPAAPKTVAFGDVNGDGKDDAIGFTDLHAQLGQVQVALSNGGNEFSQTPLLFASSFCGGLSDECFVGDVDGDDRTDVFSFNRSTGQVSVAISNGSAFVDARVWNPTLATLGQNLIGDFDGDGFDDVAVVLPVNSTLGSRGTVLVALNRPGPPVGSKDLVAAPVSGPTVSPVGEGAARATSSIASPGTVAATFAVAPGAAVVSAALVAVAAPVPGLVIPPVGSSGPRVLNAPTVWRAGFCFDPRSCVVGDFNGDGRDDIARVLGNGSSDVAISTGTSLLQEVEWSLRITSFPQAFRAADMNGDGRDDLVAIRDDGGLAVAVSDGTSFVVTVEVDDVFCGDGLGCFLADVNADGFPDTIENARGSVVAPDGTRELVGDTFVSLGATLIGFPAQPPRPTPSDVDGDGVRDTADSCIQIANPGQEDSDFDGVGDACELKADLNGDGVVNVADLAILKAKFLKNFPPADFNQDGIVNVGDLAIMRKEFFKAPSATVGLPNIQLLAPANGTFYENATKKAYVQGFVTNVVSQDLSLVVHSQTAHGQPVDTALAVAPDGYFDGFVPLDPTTPLNPIVFDATRVSSEKTGSRRVVGIVGNSVASGDLSPSTLGARLSAVQMQEIADHIASTLDLRKIAQEAQGGEVKQVVFSGPLDIQIAPFSGMLVVDITIPGLFVRVEDGATTCNFSLGMTNLKAHIEYDIEPDRLDPRKIAAKDRPGTPSVNLGTFQHFENLACKFLSTVSRADIEGKAKEAITVAFVAREFNSGPVDGAIEDAVNQLDLTGALADLGVTFNTRFRSVPEDVFGVTVDLDAGFVQNVSCGIILCPDGGVLSDVAGSSGSGGSKAPSAFVSPIFGSGAARIYQTQQVHPTFPLVAPGNVPYDVAIAIAPDAMNQLFAATKESGKLANALAKKTRDLSDSDPGTLNLLKRASLKPELRFVPTIAPFLTGLPGATPNSAEIKMGQFLLEVPTLDGQDAYREGLDLRGSLDVELVAPCPGHPLSLLKVRIHDLSILANGVVRLPAATAPEFIPIFESQVLGEIESEEINLAFPLPDFSGFGLTLIGLSQRPDGGVLAFANLEVGGPPPADPGKCPTGPILDPTGGVILQ